VLGQPFRPIWYITARATPPLSRQLSLKNQIVSLGLSLRPWYKNGPTHIWEANLRFP
jgi:hypothetical protein